MPIPTAPTRLRPIAAGHPDARRYSLARRNLLPRGEQVMAICGLWAHQQALLLGAGIDVFLWSPGGCRHAAVDSIAARVAERAGAVYQVSERVLARLHPGAEPPGLLSLARIPGWDARDLLRRPSTRVVLVADGVEYAGNLGALLRCVDASGADALLVTSPVARLTNPAVFSASRGTVLTTPTAVVESAADARELLRLEGYAVLIADPDGAVDYRDVEYGGRRTAFVVGSEGGGVSDAWRVPGLCRVAISMRGRADSLNVATAAAILLFDHAHRTR